MISMDPPSTGNYYLTQEENQPSQQQGATEGGKQPLPEAKLTRMVEKRLMRTIAIEDT